MGEQQTRQVMEIYLGEVLAQRRFERIADIAADDLVDQTVPGLTGPAALDAHARGFCDNCADLRIEVLDIIATDTQAVGIWRWHGEPTHPSATARSGAPVVPRLIASVFTFRDGKVVEYRAFVDAMDVFTQLAE